MEKTLTIRIPRKTDPTQDEPQATALAIVDRFVADWKKLLSEIEYGGAGIDATVHAGRIVKIDISRRTKLDITQT